MPQTTTALAVTKIKGPFELRKVRLDSIRPDEALVEIHASGVCHTDLSSADGTLPGAPGAVLGHEGGGVVLDVGSKVSTVSKGDKVLLSFSHCETCGPCQSGHPAYCHHFNERNFGGKRPDGTAALMSEDGGEPLFSSFFGQSTFARHTLVHKSCLVKVPPETDLALMAPLGCGIQTGAGAVMNTLGLKEGSTLAVFGVGSVGISAVIAGKASGARTIIVVDLHTSRIDLAKRLGATHGVLGSGDVVREIREICPPVGVDYAIDCTGSTKVITSMIDSLGTRGRGATVGAPGFGATVSVDVMQHLTYGKEYVGCCEGDSLPSKFLPYLIDLHAKGKLPMEELVTIYDMEDFERAMEDTKSGKTLKTVLKW